jgi:putative transposase
MNRSQVIRLNPTPKQEIYMRRACGVARHAYNWALTRWKEYRAEGKWAKLKDRKRRVQQHQG